MLTKDNDEKKKKSRDLVPKLGEVLKETSFRNQADRQEMGSKVLGLIHAETWFKSWKIMYPPLELPVFSVFFRYVVIDIVTVIIKF